MPLGKHAERLGVKMHVVDEGAVDVKDHGAGSEAKRHRPIISGTAYNREAKLP
jgi:hypothetical protein